MPAGELDPDRPDCGRRLDVEHQFPRAGDLAQPGEQPHRHAHARLNASARAVSSSGSAVAPSIHDSPPSKCSCFQIGTICFTRSIA